MMHTKVFFNVEQAVQKLSASMVWIFQQITV